MFRNRNAPGPTVSSPSSVSWLKHGQPLPLSSGCSRSTPIGAAYRALASVPERATAFAPTWTDAMPNTWAKNPGVSRSTSTVTVSFATFLLEKLTVRVPPPFLPMYSATRPFAVPGASGSACAPASAAASAAACVARSARNHEPRSSTSALMPRRPVTQRTVRTVACPRSFRKRFIPHAPWSRSLDSHPQRQTRAG